ncbi:MAG: Ca2+-binding EF-hand superfamily protein [Psychroserpens sp.]|jgi:Ca2+-binding EF-hand superfamily protein
MNLIVKHIFTLLIVITGFTLVNDKYLGKYEGAMAVQKVDYSTWDKLLKKYVDNDGNVDYKNFRQDIGLLNSYLEHQAKNPVSDYDTKESKLVYYINMYNAATLKLILDNYPIGSIKDIKGPWNKEVVTLMGKQLSLGDIEHKILRKMEEPRIHFAINCASYSCPKLLNEAFTVEKLEEQLENSARSFVNDPKKNIIKKKQAILSQIFKWYKKDFTEKISLKEFINQYSDIKMTKETSIEYINYDWSLNASK